jgi:hypothetical protein
MRPSKNIKEGFFPEKSDALYRWGYCPKSRVLEILFKGKDTDKTLRRYRYYNVDHTSYAHFSTAPSVGKAFNLWIKGAFRRRRQKDIPNPAYYKSLIKD